VVTRFNLRSTTAFSPQTLYTPPQKFIHLNSNITMPELILLIQGVDDSTDEEIVKESVTKDPFFERKVVNILRDHLQSDSKTSITNAAQSLASLLPEPEEPRGWSDELSGLWALFIAVAMQIPYHDAAMVKLVRLVVELRYSPRTAFVGYWVSLFLRLIVVSSR
jgi:hypothetical protein